MSPEFEEKTPMPTTLTIRTARRVLGVGAITLPLLAMAGCSEPEPLPLAQLVRQGDAYVHPKTMQPYSGAVFASYGESPRRIERRASLVDGHYDGPFELYFPNRKLSVREVYRGGQKDGPYEWYFEDGRLYERGTYENGLREGPYEAFFDDERLRETGSYRYGEFHGAREWYRGEQLIERVTYVHGQIDGPYERHAPDGTLLLSGTLRYGNPCGVWVEHGQRVVHPSCGYVSD
jgi:antitoxin component YwqK of YwqJK toxin-antitoxin module